MAQMLVVYEYQAESPEELTIRENDVITVIAEDPSGWWMGELNGRRGMFPSNFCQPYTPPTGGGAGDGYSGGGGGYEGDYGGYTQQGYEQQTGGEAEAPAPRVMGVPVLAGAGGAMPNELMEKLKRRNQMIPSQPAPGHTAGSPPVVDRSPHGPPADSASPRKSILNGRTNASQSVRVTPAERRNLANSAPAPAPAPAAQPDFRASLRSTNPALARKEASPPTSPAEASPPGPAQLKRQPPAAVPKAEEPKSPAPGGLRRGPAKEGSAEAPASTRPESPSQAPKLRRAQTSATGLTTSKETPAVSVTTAEDFARPQADGGARWPSTLPPFATFCQSIVGIFDNVSSSTAGNGNLGTQPSWLTKAESDRFGFALCTVDGVQFGHGDATLPFTLQQCAYPINFALCAEQLGLSKVSKFVGSESPAGGDAFVLNADQKPHNPLTLTGALAVCGHMYASKGPATRLLKCLEAYTEMSSTPKLPFNGGTLSVSMPSYLTLAQDPENKAHGLAHWLRANGVVDETSNVSEMVDLFFQLCSIETTCESLATIAATLANGGICPVTKKPAVSKAVANETVKILNITDKWAQTIGIPAKSSFSGAIIVVIPGVLGLAVYSPRLNQQMKSVAGIKFIETLASTYNLGSL